MNRKPLFLFLVCALQLIAGCELAGDCFKSTGEIVEETYHIENVRKILLYDNINLTIVPAEDEKLTLTSGKNLVEGIEVSLTDSTLLLRNQNRCNWARNLGTMIDVVLYTSGLHSIDYFGYGDILSLSPINYPDKFELVIYHGYGNIDLEFDTKSVILTYSQGAADMVLRGETEYLRITTGTMGPIDASNLHARHAMINHFGFADIRVHAIDLLEVEIRSSGNIFYRGEPQINILRWTGSGQLIHLP